LSLTASPGSEVPNRTIHKHKIQIQMTVWHNNKLRYSGVQPHAQSVTNPPTLKAVTMCCPVGATVHFRRQTYASMEQWQNYN